MLADLFVDQHSDALAGSHIDFVVTGSVGAIEAPKFARSLRRLGASVRPYLTNSAQMFTTETVMSWAAAQNAVTGYSGLASHLATGQACVVAPCTAQFLHEIAHGSLSSPASCLVASYLGQGLPVIIVPCMHDSLFSAPAVKENLQKVKTWLTVLEPRSEEGKQKFPDPAILADRVSHLIRHGSVSKRIMITMGTTRGYIDDVRYISNYSSGGLGTAIAQEAYRQGYGTTVIAGPCPIRPAVYTELIDVGTYDEMRDACLDLAAGHDGGVFAASVLDFVPEKRLQGKTASGQDLTITLKPTKKLLKDINLSGSYKVAFKLEAAVDEGKALALAQTYMTKYQLTHFVVNQLSDVNARHHRAQVFTRSGDSVNPGGWLDDKQSIAQWLVSGIK